MALRSIPTKRFWGCYNGLPEKIRRVANESYRLWKQNPFAPSLAFEEIKPDLWRIKIGYRHRALAKRYNNTIVWIWIGSHEDYNKLIGRV